jgi:hypothetical protein
MRWAWRAWTVDESRNHQRKTAREVEQMPVVSHIARRRVAENLTLKMRPPHKTPQEEESAPHRKGGGTTTSLIRGTPHGKGRFVKAFKIRARGMQKVCSLRKLMSNSWEAANWDWNSRSTS